MVYSIFLLSFNIHEILVTQDQANINQQLNGKCPTIHAIINNEI